MRNLELVTIITTISTELPEWNVNSVSKGDFGQGWVVGLEHCDSGRQVVNNCLVVDAAATLEEEIARIQAL